MSKEVLKTRTVRVGGSVLIGSDHPIVVQTMCNTHCNELEDKERLAQKQEVIFGGIVTAVRSKFTKSGKPCGFVTIEDFEGQGELAFFGEEWGQWRGMLSEGYSVYVKARCQPRFRDSNIFDLRITDIQYLQTVKDKFIERITITMDADALDDEVVTDLTTMMEESPGTTQVYVQLHDAASKSNLLLHSRGTTINVNRDLLAFIDSHPSMSYSIN